MERKSRKCRTWTSTMLQGSI